MKSFRIACTVFLLSNLCPDQAAWAQFIAYSQYYNAPLLTNPARASLTDYTRVTFHYRQSRVANYQIPSASFILPFFRQANGLRYGGVGLNVISQQAGPHGIYKVTGATGTFAYTLHLSSTSHIGAGIGGGVINKRVDASGITTDGQFNFGAYDPSLATGENILANSVTRPVINTGFCWVLTDAGGREKASLGVAAYNVNRPSFDLLRDAAQERVTYVVTGELEVLKRDRVSVSPTFRYINDGTPMANLGARVSYVPGLTADVVSAGLWYKTNGALVAAVQYERKSYVLAASMDFSTAAGWDANINNALELSLGWRLNRKERIKPRPAAAVPAPVAAPPEPQIAAEPVPAEIVQAQEPERTAPMPRPVDTGTVLTPEEEQLSGIQIQFQLGSEAVSPENDAFLDKLVTVLKNHPDYQLKITGHTCTVGDKPMNKKISYERAEAVARKLIDKGASQDQIVIIGMDFQKPIASNDTETGRQKNRRVEFEWIKK